tara:strand:- start:2754 stop:3428 length:675 start_codon:yes stop_codon:yes gene_type:complete
MPETRFPRRLMIVLIVAAAVLALLVGVGLYGLLLAPRSDPSPGGSSANDPPGSSTSAPSPGPSTPPVIRESDDPEAFARALATALFTWDTATEFGPTDYAQVIVDVGDPSGNETAGLASDVRTYLPTADAWAQLRTMQTRQWLDIDEVFVPDEWATALEQASEGQILPGTVAYTITGVRQREGIHGTEPVTSSHDVAFTVFITCEPTFDTCRALRLSELDNPLR